MTVRDELQARVLFEQRYGIAAARAQAEGLVARASVLAATGGLLRRALVFARRA